MAIFSRTQIPKYQNPIRITRPYIKPNYLADTITSAIQGYGSIQNMNLQQQLFNAKLKAQADAKAQNELDQVTARQMLSNMAPTQQLEMFYEGPQMGRSGDMGGIGGAAFKHDDFSKEVLQQYPDRYAHPSMDPAYGMTTQPGMDVPTAIAAAMQANPNANPMQLIKVAQAYSNLQPKGMSASLAYRMGRNALTDANKAIADDKKAGKAFETLVSQVLGRGIGGYGEGNIADYMVLDPKTNKLVQSKDQLEILAGSFPHGLNQTTTEYIDPKTGKSIPTRFFGDSGPHTVTTAGDNPYYNTGGQLGFQEFTQAVLRPWVVDMLKSGISPEEAAINVAKAIRGGRAKPGTASGAFNYKKAAEVVRIMQGNQSKGSVAQREANLGLN